MRMACLDDILGAEVVHLMVQLGRMIWTDRCRHMPDTVGLRKGRVDITVMRDVATNVGYAFVSAGVARAWCNVEGHDAFCAALEQHLDEPLSDKTGAAGDDAARRRPREVVRWMDGTSRV